MSGLILVVGGPYDGKRIFLDRKLVNHGKVSLLRPSPKVSGPFNGDDAFSLGRLSDDYKIEQRLSECETYVFPVLVCQTPVYDEKSK